MHKNHVFRILRGAPERGVLAIALRTEINAQAGERIGDWEFRDLITDLRGRGLVSITKDPIYDDDRVALTEAGWEAAKAV